MDNSKFWSVFITGTAIALTAISSAVFVNELIKINKSKKPDERRRDKYIHSIHNRDATPKSDDIDWNNIHWVDPADLFPDYGRRVEQPEVPTTNAQTSGSTEINTEEFNNMHRRLVAQVFDSVGDNTRNGTTNSTENGVTIAQPDLAPSGTTIVTPDVGVITLPSANTMRDRLLRIDRRYLLGEECRRSRDSRGALARLLAGCSGRGNLHFTKKFFEHDGGHDFKDDVTELDSPRVLEQKINYICSRTFTKVNGRTEQVSQPVPEGTFPAEISGDQLKRELWQGEFGVDCLPRLQGKSGTELYNEVIALQRQAQDFKNFWFNYSRTAPSIEEQLSTLEARLNSSEGDDVLIENNRGGAATYSKAYVRDCISYMKNEEDINDVLNGNGLPFETPGQWICREHVQWGGYYSSAYTSNQIKRELNGMVNASYQKILEAERNGEYGKAEEIRAAWSMFINHHGHCIDKFGACMNDTKGKLLEEMYSSNTTVGLINGFNSQVYNRAANELVNPNSWESAGARRMLDARWKFTLGLDASTNLHDLIRPLYYDDSGEVERIVPYLNLKDFRDYLVNMENTLGGPGGLSAKYQSVCDRDVWSNYEINLTDLAMFAADENNNLERDLNNLRSREDLQPEERQTVESLLNGGTARMGAICDLGVGFAGEGLDAIERLGTDPYVTILMKHFLDEGYFAR